MTCSGNSRPASRRGRSTASLRRVPLTAPRRPMSRPDIERRATGLVRPSDGGAGWGRNVAPAGRSDVVDHALVGIADHLDDLVGAASCRRRAADEGHGVLGAPPVELVAALAPVATLPFAERIGALAVSSTLSRGGAGAASTRRASSRAGVRRRRARRCAGRSRATGEVGPVEEDAGVVDESGDHGVTITLVSMVGRSTLFDGLLCHCSSVSRRVCSSRLVASSAS